MLFCNLDFYNMLLYIRQVLRLQHFYNNYGAMCNWDQKPMLLMLKGGYFTLELNFFRMILVCSLNVHKVQLYQVWSLDLLNAVLYSRARNETQESSLEKHKLDIEHLPVCPRTREKCLYIHEERHTIKFTFTHIPVGCNSCVENELLHVVQARGIKRWKGGYTYGGRGGLARVAGNVLLPRDALHAQNKP